MKKTISALLALVMVVALFTCGQISAFAADDEDYHVGIITGSVSQDENDYRGAEAFAKNLGIKSKWKTFESLWNVSNLAQEKWDMQETGVMPTRYKEIDVIFKD